MKFSELTATLPPPIARALEVRGYETATGVQAAVLDPAHADRDLLVSSQTGSGKTIAFGAALSQTLLGGASAPRAARGAPLALVVVPTRELAVQVREELSWLLAETGLRLASFTGGTAVSGDLQALQRGVDVAIGTPGRLVDLMRRERMSLASVRVVVLDEADEMLDLGFREDLQTLLQAAPAERRTLLLSATMPPEIQAMAKRFQRDAVRVDVRRTDGAAGKQGHGDITYVAHLIAGTDRLAVVVNVLRAAGEGRAIVFVTTRDGVARLHAALTARGFAAAAISGERAQAERDRALEALRRGEARVLVATNVAARGLHLPDVDLIIHADLPLNAESLTHRSGRTGRAGRKGTAVVIASLSERRKAERLLASAHVPAVWTPPPSAETITAAARERLLEELVASDVAAAPADTASVSGDGEVVKDPDAKSAAAAQKAAKRAAYAAAKDAAAEALIDRLEGTLPLRDLARRLLVRELDRLPVGERVQAVAPPRPDGRGGGADFDDDSGRKPGRNEFSRNGVVFRVNIGARDNADPRWLLPLICRRGGITRRDVGAIRIGPQATEFEIAPAAAADFALAAEERDPRAPNVVIERSGAGAGPSRPHAAPQLYASPPRQAAARPPQAPRPLKAVPKAPAPPPAPLAPPAPAAAAEAAPAKAPAAAPPRLVPPPAPAPVEVAAESRPSVPRTTEVTKHGKARPPTVETKRAPAIETKRAPAIETKRAPAISGPAKAARVDGGDRVTSPPRASTGGGGGAPWRPSAKFDGPRPQRTAAPGPRRDDRPHPRPDRPRDDRPRPERRAPDGNGLLKRPGAAAKPAFAPKGPGTGAPFWKSGARKRPGPTPTPTRPAKGPARP